MIKLFTFARLVTRELLLSLRDVLNARRGNLLACRSPHCVRDDNLYYVRDDNLYYVRDDNLFEHLSATCLANRTCRKFLVIAKERKDFFAKPKCEPATSHTCGVVEAICFQATLVFGLLRYARNDKSQDGRVVLKDSSP